MFWVVMCDKAMFYVCVSLILSIVAHGQSNSQWVGHWVISRALQVGHLVGRSYNTLISWSVRTSLLYGQNEPNAML